MQVQPDTARFVAGLPDRPGPSPDRIEEAGVNIAYGTRFLRYLIDRYGSVDLALAAYNGGPSNLGRWLEEAQAEGVPCASRTTSRSPRPGASCGRCGKRYRSTVARTAPGTPTNQTPTPSPDPPPPPPPAPASFTAPIPPTQSTSGTRWGRKQPPPPPPKILTQNNQNPSPTRRPWRSNATVGEIRKEPPITPPKTPDGRGHRPRNRHRRGTPWGRSRRARTARRTAAGAPPRGAGPAAGRGHHPPTSPSTRMARRRRWNPRARATDPNARRRPPQGRHPRERGAENKNPPEPDAPPARREPPWPGAAPTRHHDRPGTRAPARGGPDPHPGQRPGAGDGPGGGTAVIGLVHGPAGGGGSAPRLGGAAHVPRPPASARGPSDPLLRHRGGLVALRIVSRPAAGPRRHGARPAAAGPRGTDREHAPNAGRGLSRARRARLRLPPHTQCEGRR